MSNPWVRAIYLPVALAIFVIGLAGIPDDATAWGRAMSTYAPILQNSYIVTACVGLGALALSFFWGNIIGDHKARKAVDLVMSPIPDMPIGEVFYYVNPKLLDGTDADPTPWTKVGGDVLDKLATGQIQAWGR